MRADRKRTFPADSFLPPKFSVQLWTPLLTHLQSVHPEFQAALVNRIVARLLIDTRLQEVDIQPLVVDTSFDLCLARWAMWTIVTFETEDSVDSDLDLKRDTIVSLITALGPNAASPRTKA